MINTFTSTMIFKAKAMNNSDTRSITRHHHSFHPLSQSSTHRRRNSSTKPHVVVRHNVSGSNQWLKSRSLSSQSLSRSNSSILRIHPSNQSPEKNIFLSRTSVLSGTESLTGNTIQTSFKLPASIAVMTTAAIFFTLTLTSTLILGILCRREKKMRFCSSGDSSSNDLTSSGMSESKSCVMRDEDYQDGKEAHVTDEQTLLDAHDNCPLHSESYTTLDSQGHFYWFQDGDSLHDDELSYGCYGSYPFLATSVPDLPVTPTFGEECIHNCNDSSKCHLNIRLFDMPRNHRQDNEIENAESKNGEKENIHESIPSSVRSTVEHSCSLDELNSDILIKKSKKKNNYTRLREKSRISMKCSSTSTASYSEIPGRQADDLSVDWNRGDTLISHVSFETVSTRISHRSETKSENESRFTSPRSSRGENETRVKPGRATSDVDVHSSDETEAMLPSEF